MRVRWRASARGDFNRILEYIRQNSPSGARYVGRRIDERVRQLNRFPRIGRKGRAAEVYELVVSGTPYIVVYRIALGEVEIVNIFHAAQDRP